MGRNKNSTKSKFHSTKCHHKEIRKFSYQYLKVQLKEKKKSKDIEEESKVEHNQNQD